MMKRFAALLAALMLLCTCAAAESGLSGAYEAAAVLMVQGDYVQAAEAFGVLSGYMDAPMMAIYCRGLALMAEKDYVCAEQAFQVLAGFKDANVQLLRCRGMAAQAEAEAALAAGQLAEAEDAYARAAQQFAQLQYLPDMAQRMTDCRTLEQQTRASIEQRSFDGLGWSSGGMCVVRRDDLYGVVDSRGRLVVPCEWDDVNIRNEYSAEVRKNGKYGVFSMSDGLVIPCEWDDIEQVGENAVVVEKDDKYGVLSMTGEVLIPVEATEYESADGYMGNRWRLNRPVGEGETAATQSAEADLDTGLIIGWEWLDYAWLTDDVVRVRNDEGWGVISAQNGMILSGLTERIDLSGKLLTTRKRVTEQDGSQRYVYTYYDLTGRKLDIPADARSTNYGPVLSTETGDCLLDEKGQVLFETEGRISTPWYVNGSPSQDWIHLAVYDENNDGVQCVLDGRGRVLLQCDYIQWFCDECYIWYNDQDVWYMRDTKTYMSAEFPWEYIRYVGEGIFAVRNSEEEPYQLVDAMNRSITEVTYRNTYRQFNNGVAVMSTEEGYVFVNAKGEETTARGYTYVPYYDGGKLYRVEKDGLYGIVGAGGRELVACEHDWVYYDDCFYELDGALYNAYGEPVLVTAEADDWTIGGEYLYVIRDGLLTILDERGRTIY